jgi:hypothetical protein
VRVRIQPAVQGCVERAVAEGPRAALDDCPRPGREEPSYHAGSESLVDVAVAPEGERAGVTTRLLARHAREHGPAEGHPCLANLAQGTLCKILDSEEVKPHKVRYYL